MAYDIKSKFKANSPLPCWKGYERVPGTRPGAKGSCRKSSPTKHGSLEDWKKRSQPRYYVSKARRLSFKTI